MIKIPIDTIKNDFKNVFDIPDNSRIFFSGKFGIGKTYFLNDFFNSHQDKYEVFHLYPVNYQISNNEDILELIKYDILIELLAKNSNIFQEKKTEGIKDSFLLFFSWCKQNITINSSLQTALSLMEPCSETIPLVKLGRPLKNLLEMDKEFQEFKKEYEKGEKGVVNKYIEEIKKKNISEVDYFSHLLKEKIAQQKGDKKSVLILDDLDRIDPEHTFRIFNILSAYFERENENKFGFDSIIIVADFTNLKHIFHHKYGRNADFTGYIDKFYSIDPYYFDNKKAIINIVDDIVKEIKNGEPNLNDAMGDSGYIKLFLVYILTIAIDGEIINLRELLKATKYELTELRKGSFTEDTFQDRTDTFQKIFDKAIKVAIHIFSSTENFIEKLELIKNSKTKIKKRMPFRPYIKAMLRYLEIKLPESKGIPINWNHYQIDLDNENLDSIKVLSNQEEKMFFDLLIEYIDNKKYIKNEW